MNRRRLLITICIIAAITLAVVVVISKRRAVAPEPVTPTSQTTAPASSQPKTDAKPLAGPPAFNKTQLSLDDPSSLWVVANKQRPLNPKTYVPAVAAPNMKLRLSASTPEMQVSTQALADLLKLDTAAKAAGHQLMLASGYRSYDTQVAVYGNEVRAYGQTQADRQSARPGHSEHQTGLAIDLAPASGACMIQECFGTMAEGKWLAAHAHQYGFIIRYPQGKEPITGYLYEPWHLRYVGTALASELYRLGNPTLEEFFGLPPAPSY